MEFIGRAPQEDARYNVLVGSVRSSKTWALMMKIIALCAYEVGGLKLLIGVSKEAVYRNVLNDLFEIVGEANYSYNRQTGALWLLGANWIVMGAKDEGSEKYIRGATVGVAVADEIVLMPRSFFLMLLSRMSPAGARLYASTNPDSPHHWFKREILDNPRLRRGLGPDADIWFETWTMDDNPSLSEQFKEAIRRSYTGVFFKRFILSLWVVAEGAIYRDVLSDDIYYTNAERPIGLLQRGGYVERWIAIDYGTTNPCVFIDVIDDGNVVWWDREYYWDSKEQGRQKTDAEYADDLIGFCETVTGSSDPRVWPGVIVDPSAASFRAELLKRGLYVVDANNDVDDGIRRVSSMLNLKKLRINKEGCPNGVREMETYSWNEKAALVGREQPIKAHDHYPDAGRYHINTRINDWRIAA